MQPRKMNGNDITTQRVPTKCQLLRFPYLKFVFIINQRPFNVLYECLLCTKPQVYILVGKVTHTESSDAISDLTSS